MLRINLNHGYYVEIDNLNYTLKQDYVSEKTNKPANRTVGYFGNMEHLMYKYLEQCQIAYSSHEGMEMIEYVKMVEESNKAAVSGLHDVLSKYPIK